MTAQLETQERVPAFYPLTDEVQAQICPELPVARYEEVICQTIVDNQVTIIAAGTGGGKTTLIPPMIMRLGYDKVICTQPRIVAARSVTEFVRQSLVESYGSHAVNLVGYRTREEGDSKPENIIEYCTDGLQLRRILNGNGTRKNEILIIDEIHEWNANHSLLVALAKKRMRTDPHFKLVIMSATMDTEPLSKYFVDNEGKPAPVIDIPGRTFPIQEIEGGIFGDEVVNYASISKNVLAFVPGKHEIESTISLLRKRLGASVEVIALHGDQSPEEQRRAFEKYDKPIVIVATNVAQTSITVPDMDVVVSCGWERANNIKGDIEGLYVSEISASSLDQQRGRVGRTKPGIFVTATLEGFPPPSKRTDRKQYDEPAINRKRLDDELMKLKHAGYDIEDLDFYHPPTADAIDRARKRLKRLGALVINEHSAQGELSDIGMMMGQMPMSPNLARMVVESHKYGPKIRAQMLAIAAIIEARGITVSANEPNTRWQKYASTKDSDVVRQLELFIRGQQMSDYEMSASDISVRRFMRALSNYQHFSEEEDIEDVHLQVPTDDDVDKILECIASGTDYLMQGIGRGKFIGNIGVGLGTRLVAKDSCLAEANFIFGIPFDTTSVANGIIRTRKMVNFATSAKDLSWIIRHVPDRITYKPGELYISEKTVYQRMTVMFDGQSTRKTIDTEAPGSRELHEFLLYRLVDGTVISDQLPLKAFNFKKVFDRLFELADRSLNPIGADASLKAIVEASVSGMPDWPQTIEDLEEYLPAIRLDNIIKPELQAQILASSPDSIVIAGDKVPVSYKNGIAVVSVRRENWHLLPKDFNHSLGMKRRVLIRQPWGDEQPTTLSHAIRTGIEISRELRRSRRRKQQQILHKQSGDGIFAFRIATTVAKAMAAQM